MNIVCSSLMSSVVSMGILILLGELESFSAEVYAGSG